MTTAAGGACFHIEHGAVPICMGAVSGQHHQRRGTHVCAGLGSVSGTLLMTLKISSASTWNRASAQGEVGVQYEVTLGLHHEVWQQHQASLHIPASHEAAIQLGSACSMRSPHPQNGMQGAKITCTATDALWYRSG